MSEWRGKKVLVTGGAGFIGSNLAARLVQLGAKVRVADNLERGRIENLEPIRSDVEFMELDLRDRAGALKAVRGVDVVFHLAAIVRALKVYIEKPGSVILNNSLIDQSVFAAVLEAQVPSLFYASSSHIYPEDRQQSVDSPMLKESDAYPAAPGISYGWAKLVGEITARELANEFPWLSVSIGRICGAYGYNQEIDIETASLIPALCHRAVLWPAKAPFKLRGTGRETRSYCFVEDVVEALMRCVGAQKTSRLVGPVNISEEGQVSVHAIAEAVVRASGKPIQIEYDPSFPTPLWAQTVDCTKAKELLNGWSPAVSLDEGLRLTYRHIEERLKRGGRSFQ